jgi:ABC-type polysaccharide/polyol phosphate transport system ATPase subunit
VAISVRQLGKKFVLKERRATSLRETIASRLGELVGRGRQRASDGDSRVMWALKDVSFDVLKGEVVGLIGPNGAGKSVLLKILCGIMKPSEGVAEIRGRIGALLELGTGFHPELSGRDNIYLNASVLGLRRHEIEDKMAEIIDFSGIEFAIDEPVKHYSTGMSMRLAFAIACHLEPEIILLDEVWAVGDNEFQKKAMAKVQELIAGNRTVILVSHSMTTIASACTRCILLEKGHLVLQGAPDMVIGEYLSPSVDGVGSKASVPAGAEPVTRVEAGTAGDDDVEWPATLDGDDARVRGASPVNTPENEPPSGAWIWRDAAKAPGSDGIRLRSVRLMNPEGRVTDQFFIGEGIAVELTVDVVRADRYVYGFAVKDLYGSFILASSSESPDTWAGRSDGVMTREGCIRVRCAIPGGILCGKSYRLALMIGTVKNVGSKPDVLLEDMIGFDVLPRLYDNRYPLDLSAAIPMNLSWAVELPDSVEQSPISNPVLGQSGGGID